jgi:hypothetical protein
MAAEHKARPAVGFSDRNCRDLSCGGAGDALVIVALPSGDGAPSSHAMKEAS